MRFIKLPWRLYRNEPQLGPAAHVRAQASSWTASRTRSSSTPRPSTSWPGATASRSGRISAHVDRNFNEFQGNDWGLFGFFEAEDDPEVAERAARGRRGVAARARPRPDGRADGLHDQRRVRPAGRGPRAQAADPPGLASPLLPRAARGLRPRQGDGPLHVGAAARQGRGEGRLPPDDPGRREEGHGRARRDVRHMRQARLRGRARAASSRSTTPPGSATGASCR